MKPADDRVAPSPQLPLPVGLADAATLDNFLSRPALAALYAAAAAVTPGSDAGDEPLTFLHGAAEGGKSHLLQAVCHRREGAVYLPLADLRAHAPQRVLEQLEFAPLVAIDDVELITADAAWEEGLFHLVNRARARGCPLWLAARRPPAQLGLALADLASRLTGGVTWSVAAPSDDDKRAILRFRAARRGLALDDAVARYIVNRDSRLLTDLLASLDQLDRASLQLQRPLTIPLVRRVMGW